MRLPHILVAGTALRVGIGKAVVGDADISMRATLGSCVGVCIADPTRLRLGLAHVLLPRPKDGCAAESVEASRYASTVAAHLLEMLEIAPNERRKLRAYVAGGASMFEGEGQKNHVGNDNQAALITSLKEQKVQVVAEDFGGDSGRQLHVHGPTASVVSLHLDDPSQSLIWDLPAAFQAYVRQRAKTQNDE